MLMTIKGICGTWPAFWSLGSGEWPKNGEIDIIEGVNQNSVNKMVLHTDTNCKVDGLDQTGAQALYDCALDTNGPSGCDVNAVEANTYGTGFNDNNGGVYAMEWTADYIKMWFFSRGKIPASITADKPDTTEFGKPNANFQGACDIEKKFVEHKFIFDTTFCGDWAGNVYSASTCPSYGLGSMEDCKNYVATNPGDFEDAYWQISYFKTYEVAKVVSSSSSSYSSSSSTSSSSSSSSTHASTTTTSSSSSSSSTVSSSSSSSSSSSVSSSVSSTVSSSSYSHTSVSSSASSSSYSVYYPTGNSSVAYPTSTTPGYDVYSSSTPGYDVYSSSTPGYEVYSSSTPGYEVYSSSTPGYEVYSSSTPSYEVYSSSTPSYEVYSSSTPVYEEYKTTSTPVYDEYKSSSTPVYDTTTYTTTYVDVCPTGYTTVSTVYTATYEHPTTVPAYETEGCPPGFTTTVKHCGKGCGDYPTDVTVTVPITYTETAYVTEKPTHKHEHAHEHKSFPPYPTASDYEEYTETSTTVIYATQIVTLSVVPVPEKEYYASSSSAAEAKEYEHYTESKPEYTPAHYYPAPNVTVSYGSGTGKPYATETGYKVPKFTGAAATVKVGGIMGAALAAVFAFAL
jgi:hypothetical protein